MVRRPLRIILELQQIQGVDWRCGNLYEYEMSGYHFSQFMNFDHDVFLDEEEHFLSHHVRCKEGNLLKKVRDSVQVATEVNLREYHMIIAFDLFSTYVSMFDLHMVSRISGDYELLGTSQS